MREQCHILEDKSLCKTIRPWGLILHTPNGSFELSEKKKYFSEFKVWLLTVQHLSPVWPLSEAEMKAGTVNSPPLRLDNKRGAS